MIFYTSVLGALTFTKQHWKRVWTLALCMGGGLTLIYGLGLVWVFGQTRAPHWRLLDIGAAAIVLVECSRMYVDVHYLSDVLAAFTEGIAWLALSLSALAVFWQKTAKPSDHGRTR
jgi:membrane-associated phospholipid phosphatase